LAGDAKHRLCVLIQAKRPACSLRSARRVVLGQQVHARAEGPQVQVGELAARTRIAHDVGQQAQVERVAKQRHQRRRNLPGQAEHPHRVMY